MVLASIFFAGQPVMADMMIYPLVVGGVCIITSVISTFFVRLGTSGNIMGALYKGFIVCAVLSAIALWPVTDLVLGMDTAFTVAGKSFPGTSLFWGGITGLVVTGLLIWVTEYYTGTNYRPVRSVAQASTTGHGTNA